ncbi:MAG TPA: NAD(P)/FAD-dependent oxidoreductase [Candidatus Acidoferrales bacterium]|nr:NAD(P)/FAD-dependent oxidoreductase [Candidatus Acidoferrales bacterium]
MIERETSLEFDVLVAGAGPAGIAAACTAAESGAKVGVADANPNPGGQIWRMKAAERGEAPHRSDAASRWRVRLKASGATVLSGAEIVANPEPGVLVAETPGGGIALRYKKLVIATGARERFVPFPGWTLPNVMGAGGLQALVKSGLEIDGARVVIAGSGPLLLAVAAYLRHCGARIEAICEQASAKKVHAFARKLALYPAKFWQAASLRTSLFGVRYLYSSWPVAAGGAEKVEWVDISEGGGIRRIDCDYLACGFDLVPNTELAQALGCRLADGFVEVDESMQTSVEGVYCAGEPLGIGGLETALIEGQIAGFAAAGKSARAAALLRDRTKARDFAELLNETFALRDELRRMPADSTLVCRCEDVTFGRLRAQTNWRSAKLQTRCGMGPCQGRVCGPAVEFLFGWQPDSVRPPIFPARIDTLIGSASEEIPAHLTV